MNDDVLTIPQAARLSWLVNGKAAKFSYSYLAAAVNDKRIEAKKVGGIWITTRQAIKQAIADGQIGQRK